MDQSIPLKMRKCSRCGDPFQNKWEKAYCGVCRKAYLKERYASGKSKPSADVARDRHYKRNYNFSLAEYNIMFEKQGGVCACCAIREKGCDPRTGKPHNLRVDHDHKTGKVRALLCNNCNTAFGHMLESPRMIRNLLRYAYEVHPPKSKKAQEEYVQLSLLD
jgi:hypothetical protein